MEYLEMSGKAVLLVPPAVVVLAIILGAFGRRMCLCIVPADVPVYVWLMT